MSSKKNSSSFGNQEKGDDQEEERRRRTTQSSFPERTQENDDSKPQPTKRIRFVSSGGGPSDAAPAPPPNPGNNSNAGNVSGISRSSAPPRTTNFIWRPSTSTMSAATANVNPERPIRNSPPRPPARTQENDNSEPHRIERIRFIHSVPAPLPYPSNVSRRSRFLGPLQRTSFVWPSPSTIPAPAANVNPPPPQPPPPPPVVRERPTPEVEIRFRKARANRQVSDWVTTSIRPERYRWYEELETHLYFLAGAVTADMDLHVEDGMGMCPHRPAFFYSTYQQHISNQPMTQINMRDGDYATFAARVYKIEIRWMPVPH